MLGNLFMIRFWVCAGVVFYSTLSDRGTSVYYLQWGYGLSIYLSEIGHGVIVSLICSPSSFKQKFLALWAHNYREKSNTAK